MTRFAFAAAALLLASPALGACSGHEATRKKETTTAVQGKAQAPVEVTAALGPGRATVAVVFRSVASDVTIDVHGVDGLTVTSAATPVGGARFAAGESASFEVAFTPGPGRSHLVVAVSGTFGAGVRNAVASFAVGEPTAEQQKASGTATTDSEGRRIKLLPAETR